MLQKSSSVGHRNPSVWKHRLTLILDAQKLCRVLQRTDLAWQYRILAVLLYEARALPCSIPPANDSAFAFSAFTGHDVRLLLGAKHLPYPRSGSCCYLTLISLPGMSSPSSSGTLQRTLGAAQHPPFALPTNMPWLVF